MKFITSTIVMVLYAGASWGQSCSEVVYSQITRYASSYEGRIYVQREPILFFDFIKNQELCIKNSLSNKHSELALDIDTSKIEIKMESILLNCPYYCSFTLNDKNIVLFQEKDLNKLYSHNQNLSRKLVRTFTKAQLKDGDSAKASERYNKEWEKRAKPIYRFSLPIRIYKNYLIIFCDLIYYPGHSIGAFVLLKYNAESKEVEFVANLCEVVS